MGEVVGKATSEVLMEVKNLTKEYRMGEVVVHALRGVSFDIYAGEFIVVLGPSGSGKSTLLNIVGGIDKPTSGSIMYENKDISKATDKELTAYRRHMVGFVFQFYNLIPNLTARENVALAAEMTTKSIDPDELLKSVGLSERGGNFPTQLSGGEQQRVAIARAVSKNPHILLCDEPTGALDFSTGISVLRILRDFNQKYKKTVIIITHNASIGAMGDRVFYFKDGLIDRIQTNENPISPEEVSW